MAIRLTQKDKDKINRINRSIARKNKQMQNFGLKNLNLPITKANEFKTRKELNNYLEKARSYTKGYGFKFRKNKYGVVASYSEIAKAGRIAQEVSKARAKRFKEIAPQEFKTRGKGTGSSVMQRKLMGDDRYDIFDKVKFNFSSLQNREHFENRVKYLLKQLQPNYIADKNEQLKENIIKAINDRWGEKGKKCADYVKSLTADDAVKQFFTEDVFDFDFIYDPMEIARKVEIFEATYNIT